MHSDFLFREHPEIARRFPDLHPPFAPQAAVLEADRCLHCFDAPCTIACPTHIDVPKFIKKIAAGNLRGSALSILEANVLGASCARVCPVEVLCEGACVLHHHDGRPIAIGRLQRYAMDAFDASGGKIPILSTQQHREKVACIGAGPASLAAAAALRQRGFPVTIFDKKMLPGGLNTHGVAEYKLPVSAALREIERIAELGVEFRFGVDLVDEPQLRALEAEFDAIFLGIGFGAMHGLALPGAEHPSVLDALGFIEDYKLGRTTAISGRVVVIGAGNTAIDAACAVRRLGADEVRILYRRTREHISAFDFEFQHALREGVVFEWLTQPVTIHFAHDFDGGKNLRSIECVRMQIDEEGSLTPVDGSNFHIRCNWVIAAIGQSPLVEFLARCRDVQLDHGRVVIDRATGQTTNPKYYAGGDCVNGGREVVDAVADGKRAALAMANSLGSKAIA